jgi:hypothetical protein
MITQLSWLALGRPSGGLQTSVLGVGLTSVQWELEKELEQRVPPICVKVDRREKVAAKLWDIRLLRDQVPESVQVIHGKQARAGSFGVAKKLTDVLRMLVDRRRCNAVGERLRVVLRMIACEKGLDDFLARELERMCVYPHACMFADLFMLPASYLGIDTDDAADFFYIIQWSDTCV